MISKIRNRQKGFTLIELLIVVAIIGIIAALLIPNFLDALQKAKQKRTVADMRNAGTAMFSWLTDQVGAAAAGAAATDIDLSKYATSDAATVASVLVPQYLQSVPAKDGWKKDFSYWLETTEVLKANVMAIGSGGRDASTPGSSYTVAGFDPTDYDQDIIWADGFFVRWPQKTN
ncbi:MAG TPA: prepilin-type N-terminal cleavage/methylation domain-containing protein [Thermoanaerobaculia bacterium]|jgi:prepilin-type N-terminal cleavage/methylation domain-containing protein|nr:prepilin-type N-terminal cleavage/methylation domain-containing protein [Thermoanaerobaculia bacterium]